MPLKKTGAPPFLTPNDLEQDDLLEIVEEPFIVPAEKTRWGRERGRARVKLVRTGVEYRWTMNSTTWDSCIDAFGTEAKLWIGRKVKVKLENRDVGGVEKTVIFGKPYKEPQQSLDKPVAPQGVPVDVAAVPPELASVYADLDEDQRAHLLEYIKTVKKVE